VVDLSFIRKIVTSKLLRHISAGYARFFLHHFHNISKAVPLQTWSGPEGSRKLRFPDFMTTAQDVGKVVRPTHRPPSPQEIHLVLISVRAYVDPRAIVRPEGLSLKNSNNTIGNRTRGLPVFNIVPETVRHRASHFHNISVLISL
jgi:hypothetical protein